VAFALLKKKASYSETCAEHLEEAFAIPLEMWGRDQEHESAHIETSPSLPSNPIHRDLKDWYLGLPHRWWLCLVMLVIVIMGHQHLCVGAYEKSTLVEDHRQPLNSDYARSGT
jgi:hypothetical protein